ncbi:MAG: hypothetical protein WDZ53_10890, partial [Balneolales bacterium]
MKKIALIFTLFFFVLGLTSWQGQSFDVIIKNGTIYDGSGNKPYTGDIAILNGRIVQIGGLDDAAAREVIDASGKAVSPGFINVLSWAANPLLADGRSMSNIKQGVTLEVFGVGWSMGPVPGYNQ